MSETLYRIICIVIMCLATYIPRALPITFYTKKIESRFIKDFLYYVPYGVLSAMTFPAILFCVGNIYIALIGTCIAIILSLFKQKLIVVASAAVLVVYGLSFIL